MNVIKLKTKMYNLGLLLSVIFLGTMVGCNSSENPTVSEPIFKVGAGISTKTPLSGIIKGTLLSDSVYTVNGDVIINENDTLVIQQGARVHFPGTAVYSFVVKGTLLSLGTKEKPIYFTVPTAVKTDTYGADVTKDPAFKGLWGGILGETAFKSIIIKWTHLEFGGGREAVTPVSFIANGGVMYTISCKNPNGFLVLEDSWIYGSVDDPIRPFGCKFSMMRNTFEKCGLTGGEAFNVKSNCIGNFAYNLVVGMATNGPKASNNGAAVGSPATNVYFYNNTIVECGFRRSAAGRGGSTSYEENSKGYCYNNLLINCKFGTRVVAVTGSYAGNPLVAADTANLKYGNNYSYVDDLASANEIYPTLCGTKPQSTDIPTPSTFLPTGYKPGDKFDGSSVVGKNNPQFVGFTLPRNTANKLGDISFVGTSDFHLQSTSPAVGKGFTGFTPVATGIPESKNFGTSPITAPGKDIGAFQIDKTGNQH
ncbi:MAG: hypothetical protein ACKVOQ_21760 [Cyclobacteriaceae bacterium]